MDVGHDADLAVREGFLIADGPDLIFGGFFQLGGIANGGVVVSLYFDQGDGKRYRSLGCWPCTKPVESTAKNLDDIIEELKSGKFARIAERSGREQDKEDGGGLEELRRGGYM